MTVNLMDAGLRARFELAGALDAMPGIEDAIMLWPKWVAELAEQDFTPDEWAPSAMMPADTDFDGIVAGETLAFVVVGDGEIVVIGAEGDALDAALAAGFRTGTYDQDDPSASVEIAEFGGAAEPEPEPEYEGAMPRPAGRVESRTGEGATVTLADTIAANAVLVTVSIHSFGIRRQAGARLDVSKSGEKIDESILSIGKKLIDSTTWDEIASLDGSFRREVEKRALPSRYRRGTWLLPIRLLDWFEEEVEVFRAERNTLVDQLCSEYAALVEDARVKLASLFDRRQYPPVEVVRDCYRIDTQYEAPSVPKALESLAPDIFRRESRKLRASMEEAAQETRMALRRGLQDLVANLQDKLTDEPGKRKVLTKAAVENLQEWLSLFDDRDITNDSELAALVERCKRLMAGVDRDLLATDAAVQREVKAGFAQVTSKMSGMVEAAPVRRFKFSDED
jgi:hypothetical protein